MEQQRENKMGSAPMLGLILSLSLPAMFSMLVQALYNVVDSYFVAKIGVDALTAVSLAFPVQNLMIAIAVGTGVGLNSLVSRRLGEGRREEANSAATHSILLGVANWVMIALLGLVGTQAFFGAFSSNPTILKMGTDYTYIVTILSFGLFVEVNIEKTLQATGNMLIPMFAQLLGAITNIILDPIMIFGLLGVPKMGVAGAAIATVIGQILSMVFILVMALTRTHAVSISLRNFRFRLSTVRDVYAVGLPAIVMQSIGSVMTTCLNSILIQLNEIAVAILGVYFKVQSFVFMPVFGLTQGLMPIIGYNFGARKKQRLMSAVKIGLCIASGIMAAGTALFMFLPGQLLSIFDASEEMLAIGVPAFRMICLCFIPAALGISFSTLFQAVGKGTYSLLVSLLRQLVLIVPIAYLLARVGGLHAVWYAFPLAESGALVASISLLVYTYRRSIKTLDLPVQPENGLEG